jgi:ADP-ribosylglycohydrolase
VDSLLNFEFDTQDMGLRFAEWMHRGLWTAWGEPFDIGIATSNALMRIANGTPAEQAGGHDECSNGNGSLMRILPVALRFANESTEILVERVSRASAITHGHERSKIACAFYGLVARQLLLGMKPQAALDAARVEFIGWYERSKEFPHFRRVLQDDLAHLPEAEILSTGYVLHTLPASLWCLLTTGSFEECVLKAVNLGGDTDTTGCVAGGLAGVHYRLGGVPEKWQRALARHDELESLLERFVAIIPACA